MKGQCVCVARHGSCSRRGADPSASQPSWRWLVFAPVSDSAPFAAGKEFENDFLFAVQACPAMVLGSRQHQPAPRHDFVGPTLTQHFVTAVGLQFQGRHGTWLGFTCDFYLSASISSGKEYLSLRWHSREKQSGSAQCESPKRGSKYIGINLHFQLSRGPRQAVRMPHRKFRCKLGAKVEGT
jgi:hypothetical protein